MFCLLVGLYEDNSGTISLDGIPISNLNKSLLRHQIGTLLKQDQLVFASYFDNVAMGRKDITFNDVVQVSQTMELTDFAEDCPDKYETFLNPEGHYIPKDVTTKLLIARAIIGNPRLLLLEDPTSGMNSSQSRSLRETIGSMKHTTILMATHDQGVHKISDRIIQIEQGNVIFDGSYQSFTKKA